MALRRLKSKNDFENFAPKPQKSYFTPPPVNHDESNWLVSYADMMTLLCGFFIMMFALSNVDQAKFEKAKQEIAKEFHGKYEKPANAELAAFITQVIQDAKIEKDATIRYDESGVSVAFQSTVFFDTLSADVKPEGRIVLDKMIGAIANRQASENKQYKIVVEGHTDSRPILGGTFPSNWELSGARAARVVRLFLERSFAPDHLTAIGYSDTRPEAPSRTPAGTWDEDALSKNRRVVLRILAPDASTVPLAPSLPQPAISTPATTAH